VSLHCLDGLAHQFNGSLRVIAVGPSVLKKDSLNPFITVMAEMCGQSSQSVPTYQGPSVIECSSKTPIETTTLGAGAQLLHKSLSCARRKLDGFLAPLGRIFKGVDHIFRFIHKSPHL
jgi:hypothetical protein